MIHHMNVWNVARIYFAGPEYNVFYTNLVSFFFSILLLRFLETSMGML